MKRFLYIMFTLGLSTPALAFNDKVQKTISAYTKKHIEVYANTANVSKLGYDNCDFLKNGESLVIQTFIKQNDLVIDAGAHVGNWTKYVLGATHRQCTVYAFEPVPDSYKSLKVLSKKYKNKVFSFNVALGNCETTLEMNYFFEKASDCSTLFARPVLGNFPVKKITVPVTYLDKFAFDHAIQHVHFLKIDTEGAEFSILMGAQNLIQNKNIDIIQFEYGGAYFDAHTTLRQVYDYLTSYNYLIFRIVPDGLIHISEWDEQLENFLYSNYLALKIVV